MIDEPIDTSFLLLCGGKGERLGGADKPLQVWRGRPLIEHINETVDPTFPRFVSANRNLDKYAQYGEVFTDADAADFGQGPLLGIYGALSRITTEWLLVTPGDTPLLAPGWGQRLSQARREGAGAVAHDGTRQQHLHLLLPTRAKNRLGAFLEEGRIEVFRFLEELDPAVVTFADARQFRNFNERRDFESD